MKHRLLFLSCLSVILVALTACSKDEGSDTPLYQYDSIEYDANRKILITYFSWGGNTQHLAEEIANMTGGTLFRIETVNPYPTDYREETLAKIVELTPGSRHLQGFGTTGRNTGGVESWLRTIHIIR